MERVDAVVIGAGLGGLAAAATLAREGRHVVVLEQQQVPGVTRSASSAARTASTPACTH